MLDFQRLDKFICPTVELDHYVHHLAIREFGLPRWQTDNPRDQNPGLIL